MFKPDQDVNRFGNRVFINEYGMHSDSASNSDATKVNLVFGVSVHKRTKSNGTERAGDVHSERPAMGFW
jgi:hypothetical protein